MSEQTVTRKQPSAFQDLLDFLSAANRSGLRGVSVIAISTRELQAALDMSGVRTDLVQRLRDAARRMEARFFDINRRIVVIVPTQREWDLMQAVYDMRMLVLSTVGRIASELGFDPSDFTQVLHSRRDNVELQCLLKNAVYGSEELRDAVGPPGPLTDQHISALAERAEKVGSVTFVREFVRMQAMARIALGEQAEMRGREIYMSMADLQRQLLPGVDLTGDAEQFRQLTKRLDRIVLQSLAESKLIQGNISVNINVENLFTKQFERVAQRLYERDNTTLTVELDISDVFTNMADYKRIRPFLRRCNVRVLGDSMPPELVTASEGTGLGLDGYKFIHPTDKAYRCRLAEAVKEVQESGHTAVLTRVEEPGAIEVGQELGIHIFQGFYIDDLLSQPDPGRSGVA